MSKTNQIRLLVGVLVLVGFISLDAILTHTIEVAAHEAGISTQRVSSQQLEDVVNGVRPLTIISIVLLYAAVGLALGMIAPYTKSELFWGTITVIVPISLLPLFPSSLNLLTVKVIANLGMGIIYATAQFWIHTPETDFPIYLGLIQQEDGSLAQIQWMRESGRVMLHSTKSGETKMLTVRGNLAEAQSFFQQLRSKQQA
jgi:hypothetical protein